MVSITRETASGLLSAGDVGSPEPVRELIFAPGYEPFVASHASTIVELKGGTLMAAWLMGVGKRCANLLDDTDTVEDWDRSRSGNQPIKWLSLHIFHNDVRKSVVFAKVINRDDVGFE